MSFTIPTLPYEEAAEIRTLTGWACRTCGTFWAKDERAARYCCAKDMPCECGRRREKHYVACRDCRRKRDIERFEAMERRPWDGKQMIYSQQLDRYFSSPDDAREYLEEGDHDLDPFLTMEFLRLVLCRPNNGRSFDIEEHLSDDFAPDDDNPLRDSEVTAINNYVNQWITERAPFSWEPDKFALDLSTT